MVRRIRSLDDLAALQAPKWRRSVARINLEIAADTADARPLERIEAAINRDLRYCGCIEAAACCFAALVALPLILASGTLNLPADWLQLTGLGLVYLCSVALVGKFVGIVLAERRLASNVRRLEMLLAGQQRASNAAMA